MRRSLILLSDAVAVIVFVVIGRRNHEQTDGFSGFLETVAPFLIAVVIGWLVARAWKNPTGLTTGFIVAGITVVAGLLLRNLVFSEGTETSFLFVAAGFLTFFIVGWRLVAAQFAKRSTAGA
ncbi:DUF3054 domain-containing protein [bacterium]|nr:DUF3054 domain-containing protein [bacterium]